MTPPKLHALNVVALPVADLDPNPWNPNRVDARTMAKLRAFLVREGFVKPLLVRPSPEEDGRYQILNGEHRWRIARDELEMEEVPGVIVEVDDHRARVLTVNLNELGGEPAPDALAQLVHDLALDASLADLETELPYSLRELEDSLALLKVPHGLALELDQAAKSHEDGAPQVLQFVVDEAEVVETTMGHLTEMLEGKNRRGRALVMLCRDWLERREVALGEESPDA